MYVLSAIIDEALIEDIFSDDKYLKDRDCKKSLYELAYVDYSGGYSCANDEMCDSIV